MEPKLTRRRALAVLAGLGLAAHGVRAASARVLEWRGTALGADATLVFASASKAQAEEALALCRAEIDRLERIFSLYLDESEISLLNARGSLIEPSFDMQALLTQSLMMHRATDGLFDPTVQAIWEFRRNLAATGADVNAALPGRVLEKVGIEKITMLPESVVLPSGMSISLNGIAQGYITDRVADILRRRGWRDVLIDLGETRALDGRSFDVLVRESGRKIPLANGALATSSSMPLPLGASAGLPHVFHPRSGTAASRDWSTVTVAHASATTADALSTALMLCGGGADLAGRIMSRFPTARAWISRPDRDDLVIGA